MTEIRKMGGMGTTEHEKGYGCLEDRPGDSTLLARRLKTNYQTTNTNPIYTIRTS